MVTSPERERRLRILVVEDHADSARMLEMILTRWGYDASVVTSCAAAVDAAACGDFDVAMCDFQLPDGDGAELMRQLSQVRGVRCIAVTAHANPNDGDTYLRDGIEHVLPKPYTFDQLRGVLDKALASRKDEVRPPGVQGN